MAAELNIVDLFSGVGGLSLGLAWAAGELGYASHTSLAVDVDGEALGVFLRNHAPRNVLRGSVSQLVDFRVHGAGAEARFRYPPEIVNAIAAESVGKADVVLAGPPCQGNSTLNNHTRFADSRNALYLTVPATAIALRAPRVIIENVPGVVRSRGNVVETAATLFEQSGYAVSSRVLAADALGWPQTRRRFFLVAVREEVAGRHLDEVARELARPALPLSWAIGDLLDRVSGDTLDSVAELSAENSDRIAWLFDNDEYEMPNHLRPDCHKDGTTYNAVYGRMNWGKPAPTLTTGFLTPGRGRYVHPLRKRTLTPREAARVQGFPDWFDFRDSSGKGPSRRQLGKWIGNAVPPILGYAAGIAALDGRRLDSREVAA